MLFIAGSVVWAQVDQTRQYDTAVGVVFNDKNHNGIRDNGEKGIAGVRVSDGRVVIKTDSKGRYKLNIEGDAIIFVIKPKGWMTPVSDDNIPRFYYIHKPKGSPKMEYKGTDPTGPLPGSIDFPLYRYKEPNRFDAIFFGDTQTYNQKEIDYLAHDIVEELVGTNARLGVTLGDITGDNPSLHPVLMNRVGLIGIPWYNVIGNHDRNYDAPSDEYADDAFERTFGPSYYSYDYGSVHFIALDDPYTVEGNHYEGRLGAKQLIFIKNDLSMVPKDQLIVLMMHIPIFELRDRDELYKILEQYPNVLAVAAHYHTQVQYFLTEKDDWHGPNPLHLLINATACGSFWCGLTDEVGLPNTTMCDGAPNGYSIITFDGNKYSVRFKAARWPADYQMNIYAPDEVKATDAAKTQVFVNIFAGTERSKVEMRLGEDGPWIPMVKTEGSDPVYVLNKKAENELSPSLENKLPDPGDCTHLWKAKLPANLPAGVYLIYVCTTDMYGQVYTSQRVVNIK